MLIGVGKTCLFRRFKYRHFREGPIATTLKILCEVESIIVNQQEEKLTVSIVLIIIAIILFVIILFIIIIE